MSHTSYALLMEQDHETATMKALVFHGPGNISLETVPIPKARAGEVVIRVPLTTICGTDLHILKGEYPVKPGLIIGHEPVGVIHEIGDGVSGYEVGDESSGRSYHAMRSMQLLLKRKLVAVRWRDRRLEVRQHHRRRPSGVFTGPLRATQPGQDPGRADG